MIMTPNRLAQAAAAIERGELVDWKRVGALQAIDLVLLGRQFLAAALQREEEADGRLESVVRSLGEVVAQR